MPRHESAYQTPLVSDAGEVTWLRDLPFTSTAVYEELMHGATLIQDAMAYIGAQTTRALVRDHVMGQYNGEYFINEDDVIINRCTESIDMMPIKSSAQARLVFLEWHKVRGPRSCSRVDAYSRDGDAERLHLRYWQLFG